MTNVAERLTTIIIAVAYLLAFATSTHHAAVYFAGSEGLDVAAAWWGLAWGAALEMVIGAATARQIAYAASGKQIPRQLWVLLIGLIVVSAWANACYTADHSAQVAWRRIADIVFAAATLPLAQALYVHVATSSRSTHQPLRATERAATVQPSVAVALADVEPVATPKRATVKRNVATPKVAATKRKGGGVADGNPYAAHTKEYYQWRRVWQAAQQTEVQ